MDKIAGYYLDINPHKRRPINFQLYKYLYGGDLELLSEGGKVKKITSKKGISVATAIKASNSGSVALFAPHKRGNTGVEGLAEEALKQLRNRNNLIAKYAPEGHLIDLAEYFTIVFGSDYLLTQCARVGLLFHHGDFPQNIREIIEDSLREGKIRLVICTNTLSEGVNLPIKTIVIHSTKRFNPFVIGNYESMKIRDLKNLVGRAGRAGKETKGMVIIPHDDDFARIDELMRDRNIEPVKGQLYNIVNLITSYLQKERMPIAADTLDLLSEQYLELLDSIDISMIDLLAAEVEIEQLDALVTQLISQTLSFYQANPNEKKTLTSLFELRVEKLKPIVERGEFAALKNSGANIRLYEEINSKFDFTDEIWNLSFNALDDDWLSYLLDNGIFQMSTFASYIEVFNKQNKCVINGIEVKKAIVLWMNGSWYKEIAEELNLEIYQILRLISSVISFNIQTVISTIIRLKEISDSDYVMPNSIVNWPSFLQHGINKQLQLDLIEMGLIDRVSVRALGTYFDSVEYDYIDYNYLRAYLLHNGNEILNNIRPNLPAISFEKLAVFIDRLNIREMF